YAARPSPRVTLPRWKRSVNLRRARHLEPAPPPPHQAAAVGGGAEPARDRRHQQRRDRRVAAAQHALAPVRRLVRQPAPVPPGALLPAPARRPAPAPPGALRP